MAVVTWDKSAKQTGRMYRNAYTLEIKQFAIEFHKKRMKRKDIISAIEERYGICVPPSTLTTWCTRDNMKRIEAQGSENLKRSVMDMEYFLSVYLERHRQAGIRVSDAYIKTHTEMIHKQLVNTGRDLPVSRSSQHP